MLTQFDVERALQHYDLGEVRSVRPASHGAVNETAFVETSIGRYVVRRNQRKQGLSAVDLRHRLMAWLRARGFPAPRLIPARNGDQAIDFDGRFFEVQTFIEGDEFNHDRPAHLAGTGSILAHYHNAVDGFPDPPLSQGPRYSTSSLSGLIERIMQRDMMGDLTVQLNWYDRRAADLKRSLSEQSYEALPHVLIHGDVHRDNLIFRGDTVAALIDFDQVTLDARLVDLADALVDFAVGMPPKDWYPWGVYAGPLDAQRAAQLLNGYDQIAPLSSYERKALPLMIEVIWLQGNLRRVLTTHDADPDYHCEVLGQGQRLAEWLHEHLEAMNLG
ncbi:homoserine kinase [Candidatus Chloroploca sp. Khr17]|uniref:homoserine kinase n=1 Tax=Candidatus Chloroploca sp. Khr17 TaxID=2496869 RepID=UPI00101CFC93|nr:homoserine kinase [Candidatus Chloroploca sp. Khr17]